MSKRRLTPAKAAGSIERLNANATTWRMEAHAALDAGTLLRRVALTLPDDSRTRHAMLERAQGYVLGAALRGVESPQVRDDLRAEIAAGDRIAAERVLAVAA